MLDYLVNGNERAYNEGFKDGYSQGYIMNDYDLHELKMLVIEIRMQGVSELIDVGYLEGLEYALTLKRMNASYMSDFATYEKNLRYGIKK